MKLDLRSETHNHTLISTDLKIKLTAATVRRSKTLQQYLQALALPYFVWHSSEKKITTD